MKKIISALLLLVAMGCEFHPHRDHTRPTVVYPTTTTVTPIITVDYCGYDPSPYPVEWADYCYGSCCVYETYQSGWICEETWCYDDLYCDWELTEFCY